MAMLHGIDVLGAGETAMMLGVAGDSRGIGRGLETLGHAAEYLLDSRVFLVEERSPQAERDAVKVLMRLSRTIFQEGAAVTALEGD